MTELSRFVEELRRRNVFRTGAAYLVIAWLLVQVADILLGAFSAPAWALRSIVIALAVGFPIAVVLAWIYDVTSQGVKRTSELNEGSVTSRLDGRKLDFVIIGILLVAVVLFAIDRFNLIELETQQVPLQHSIAVLPFSYLGPDKESEYLADAMTDELIGRLGRINSVRIKSRLSVARFKDHKQGVDDVAAELNVDYILEGSIRKADERVHITAQLTDAGSGFDEWSDIFNGESEDWFALHEEMAVEIADALNLHLSADQVDSIRAHYTRNQRAYDAFWRGWLLLESFHVDVSHPADKVRAAEAHLQRALELDPDYPLALAGLALANSYAYFYGVEHTPERRDRGMELARRALAIDPNLPEGRIALGVALGTEDNHASAVAEFRKALADVPEDAMTWCLLAFSCIAQQPPDLKAAEEAALISISHDPTWTYSHHVLGWTLFLQGRYEESADAYLRGIEFDPEFFDAQFGLGQAHLELGNFDRALSALRAASELRNSSEVLVYIAACHAGLGNLDEAFANLERSLELGFRRVDAIEGSPYFETLRTDPRYEALLELIAVH